MPAIVHMVLGRPPAPAPAKPFPDVPAAVVAALVEWRQRQTGGSQQEPEKIALIVGFIVIFHLKYPNEPWPLRRQVLAHLGVSSDSLSKTIAKQIKLGNLWYEVLPPRSGPSVIQVRRLVPSRELIAVVRKAMRVRQ